MSEKLLIIHKYSFKKNTSTKLNNPFKETTKKWFSDDQDGEIINVQVNWCISVTSTNELFSFCVQSDTRIK